MSAIESKALRVTMPRHDCVRALAVGTSNVTTSVNGIKQSVASSASAATYSGGGLDGSVQIAEPARNVIVTTTASADIDAVDVVIVGTDWQGNPQRDVITLTADTGATDAGTRLFRTVTSITVPAQSGTGGSLQFGWGTIFSLEEFVGSYVSMAADQIFCIVGHTPGEAIAQPVIATSGHGPSDARAFGYPATIPQPFFVTRSRAACKAVLATGGTLRWMQSEAEG